MNNWIIYLNLAIPSVLMAMPFILRMVVPNGNYGVIAIISLCLSPMSRPFFMEIKI